MSEEIIGHFRLRRFAGAQVHVEQLDQLRVVHLTDLHVGRVTPMATQLEAVTIANNMNPDLVAITGDFVCHSQAYLDELTEVVSRIKAPVFCVLGNHDYWSGAREVRWALGRADAEILDNVHTVFTARGQRVQIVGLDDAYTGHASREKAVKGLRKDLPSLGLSHIAEEADGLWQAGVPLVLSGHTHGGQITVARLHEIALGRIAGHKYVHGLYGSRYIDYRRELAAGIEELKRGESQEPEQERSIVRPYGPKGAVYVSAGVGASVMPFRLGERGKREVAVFELGHQPGSFEEHHDEQDSNPGRKPSSRKSNKRAVAVARKQKLRDVRRPSWYPD